MSRDLLEHVVARQALKPPVAYSQMADVHVDLDETVAEGGPIRGTTHPASQSGEECVVVLGPIGSGKSSLIAAVAARVEPDRFPIRVRGLGDSTALDREVFARHLAEEALDALERGERSPAIRQGTRLRGKIAEERRREAGGHSVGRGGTRLRSAIETIVKQSQPSTFLSAVEEIVDEITAAGRTPLVVLEDTDSFAPPRDQKGATERAERFVHEVVPYLAREVRCPSLVAVHERYRPLLEGSPAEQVAVPRWADASVFLSRVLERYGSRRGLSFDAAEIVEPGAFELFVAALDEHGNIRDTLRSIAAAAEKTVPTSPRPSASARRPRNPASD